jgi:xanthine dehydrogenase accessory factor
MKPTATFTQTLDDMARDLRGKGTPFALATVTRTFDATSAKPGAKALLNADGEILEGWVGGGCARGAIARAARTAIARGEPVLVALRPDDKLAEAGVEPCELRDGMVYERNGCASKGSMDVFVEAFAPAPEMVVLGDGPVASALRNLAKPFDFRVTDRLGPDGATAPYIVVATQGKGDIAALEAAAKADPRYLAFVGSRRKAGTLKGKLMDKGMTEEMLERIVAPAGLDIGAATPDEIALSILGQIVAIRRGAA